MSKIRQQKIKLGKKELTLQSLDTKSTLEFQSTILNMKTGQLDLVKATLYILKNVIVKPQGLTVEDFEPYEINALYNYCESFLGLEEQQVIIQEIE